MPIVNKRVMGRDIDLGTEDSYELELHSAVDYVNEKYEQEQKQAKTADTHKIAALTAVKIAAELLRIKGLQDNISNNYERKISSIINDLKDVEKLI